MKCVKVKIVRGGANGPMMKYPAKYDAQEVDRNGIGSCGVNPINISYSGAMNRGADCSHCIIILSDVLADEYAQDPDMEIITDDEADLFMEEWRVVNNVPEETVSDQNRLLAIQVKQSANMLLSAEDFKALDVDDPMPGITKSRRSVKVITEAAE